VYEALDRGYFKDEGLDVQLTSSNDTAVSAQMVATGQVAFENLSPDPVFFNAMDRGIDLKIVASSVISGPNNRTAVFLVRQDLIDSGRYKAPADLKGMKVAAGPVSYPSIDRVLTMGGLTMQDVDMVNLTPPAMFAAFKNKGIDAAWLTEPLATQANVQHLAKTVITSGQVLSGVVAAAVIMAPSFLKDRPDAAQHLLIAYVRGLRDYYHAFDKKDASDALRAQVVQTFIKHTAVKNPALYTQIGLPEVDPNGAADPTQSWENVYEASYLQHGLIQHKVDLSKHVDFSILNSALSKLGRET